LFILILGITEFTLTGIDSAEDTPRLAFIWALILAAAAAGFLLVSLNAIRNSRYEFYRLQQLDQRRWVLVQRHEVMQVTELDFGFGWVSMKPWTCVEIGIAVSRPIATHHDVLFLSLFQSLDLVLGLYLCPSACLVLGRGFYHDLPYLYLGVGHDPCLYPSRLFPSICHGHLDGDSLFHCS